MKSFCAFILLAILWAGTAHSEDGKKDNAPEGYDCIECTISRGPAVVLEEDVQPAEHMEGFVASLPVTDAKSSSRPGISRSPAIVNNPE